jgi:hypothetical protein
VGNVDKKSVTVIIVLSTALLLCDYQSLCEKETSDCIRNRVCYNLN